MDRLILARRLDLEPIGGSRARVLAVAMTRSGKTTLSVSVAGHWARQGALVVIVDPKASDPILRQLVPAASRGLPSDPRRRWCRVCPQDADQAEAVFAQVWSRGDCWLWVDELALVGDARRCPRHLEMIYRQGAARGIGVWALTQDPVGIPTVAKSQSSGFIIGRNGNPDYIDACARLIGSDPGRLRAWMEQLPRWHLLWWTHQHGIDGRQPEIVPSDLKGAERVVAEVRRSGSQVREGRGAHHR